MATKADESEGIRPNTAANIIDRITIRFIVGGVAGSARTLLRALCERWAARLF
jgi:hypothetical protein